MSKNRTPQKCPVFKHMFRILTKICITDTTFSLLYTKSVWNPDFCLSRLRFVHSRYHPSISLVTMPMLRWSCSKNYLETWSFGDRKLDKCRTGDDISDIDFNNFFPNVGVDAIGTTCRGKVFDFCVKNVVSVEFLRLGSFMVSISELRYMSPSFLRNDIASKFASLPRSKLSCGDRPTAEWLRRCSASFFVGVTFFSTSLWISRDFRRIFWSVILTRGTSVSGGSSSCCGGGARQLTDFDRMWAKAEFRAESISHGPLSLSRWGWLGSKPGSSKLGTWSKFEPADEFRRDPGDLVSGESASRCPFVWNAAADCDMDFVGLRWLGFPDRIKGRRFKLFNQLFQNLVSSRDAHNC